jgi:hypothetical protein
MSDQKITRDKKYLEFNFRDGLFYAENSKCPKILKFWGPFGPG